MDATKSKTILVTAGTGLIGSHLSNQLAARGHQLLVLSRSSRFSVPEAIDQANMARINLVCGEIEDKETLTELVKKSDVVFHLAASVGALGAVENTKEYIQTSISGTATLVDVLRTSKHNVASVVLSSSLSVYGEGNYVCARCCIVRPDLRYAIDVTEAVGWDPRCPNCGGVISPTQTPETATKLGESIYAATRKAQEDLLSGTCRSLSINLAIFRLGTVVGAGQSWHNPFTRFLELLLSEQPPVLHEDGMQSRDFIFAEDVVAAGLSVLEKDLVGVNAFNVGSGQAVSLKEFVERMAAKMATALKSTPVEAKIDHKFTAGDVRHCHIDCTKMEKELGVVAQKSLDAGLDDLVSWFVRKKGSVVGKF